MFVEKQFDVAVSSVCLFVCLFAYLYLESSVPADIIQVQMEGELIFIVTLNDLLIGCIFSELTHHMSMLYI